MGIIRNVWVDAAGLPLRNVWVMTTLISRAGWSKTGQSRAVRVHSDMTDATGLWTSPDLPPQSSYEETGTYYRVECEGKIEYFDVPDAPGTYWLADRRRAPVPIDADWKVLAKLSELPDAKALAGATDGQVPVWNTSTSSWQPVTRVTAQQLADGLASKAAKQYTDDADQALSNRISPLETWKPTVDTALAGKASTTSVTGVSDRVTTNTSDIASLKQRVTTVEGGGSGSSGAVQHGSLQYLVTKADGSTADDHPQYLTATRGDGRYYTKSTADATFAGLTHAGRHASGGADPITPAAIGASPAGHVITDHPNSGAAIQTLIPVPLAGSSASNKAHAMMTTAVPADNGADAPYYRSVRQQISHMIDGPIGPLDMGNSANNNTVYYTDFVPRETCNLFYDVNVYQNLKIGGQAAAGTAGGGFMSVVFYDMTGGGTEVWRDQDGYYYVSFNATYDFRPTTMASVKRLCPFEFKRGNRYRFQIYARAAVSAPVNGWYVRGALHEVVALTG